MQSQSVVFFCALLLRVLITSQTADFFFLEHPRSITVTEGSSATFNCSIINSSFNLHWLVNGSDAGYTRFREKGVDIVSVNSTTSTLEIVGHVVNNNTIVSCVALRFGLHRVWAPSENATLLVLATSKPNDLDPIFSRTLNLTSQMFKTLVQPRETMANYPGSGQNDEHAISFEVIGALVASSIVLMAVAVVLILLVITRIRLKDKAKSGESSANAIELQSNVIYEYRKPVPCQQNPAYDLVPARTSK